MNFTSEHITTWFRDRLSNYKEQPDEEVWPEIQNGLMIKSRRKSLMLYAAVAGAAFIGLAAFFFWEFFSKEETKEPVIISKEKTAEATKKEEWLEQSGSATLLMDDTPFGDSLFIPQDSIQDEFLATDSMYLVDDMAFLEEKSSKETKKRKNQHVKTKEIKKKLVKQDIKEKVIFDREKAYREFMESESASISIKYSRDSTVIYKLNSRTSNKVIFENKFIAYPSKVIASIDNSGKVVFTFQGFDAAKDGRVAKKLIRVIKRKDDEIEDRFFND